jgi:adenine-specific DNA-methyltransferase
MNDEQRQEIIRRLQQGEEQWRAVFIEFLRKRLVLLRQLLSPTGSIYLHLDHRKGHYVKVIMDEVFGEHRIRNCISRIKCSPKNYTSKAFGNIHDLLFFYSMGTNSKVNELYLERILAQVLEDFPHYDEKVGKRFKTAPLHARGIRKGETGKPWRGIKPPLGNHWRYIHATLDALDKAKLIEWSDTGNPRKKIYAEDSEGYAVQDIWDFKDPGDRLASYPTEKSEYLLNHIIRASSSPGDIVLDAFSGSGTTLAVAEKLGRRWIGIDCGKFAIYSIQKRLLNLRAEIGNFIELPARDLTASQAFFETVFGMTMTGFGPTYACTLTGGRGYWTPSGPTGGPPRDRGEGSGGNARRGHCDRGARHQTDLQLHQWPLDASVNVC